MSLFGVLNAGATGLHANGFGMSVTSQNAQNTNTEGYTRRDLRLAPISPPPDGGGGVRVRGSRRVMAQHLERRLLGATAARAEGRTRHEALGILDQVLAEVEGGLGASLDDFEVALTELTDRPADPATRRAVLGTAERLSASFVHAAHQLNDARAEIDSRIEAEVDALDTMLTEIADLGTAIHRSEIGGTEASDLRDRRDQLVRELSEKLPVSTVEDDEGGLSVLLGGLALVTPDGRAAELSTSPDPTTGALQIMRTTAGAQQNVTELVDSGQLGGLVAARDGALQESIDALDQLAFDITSAYNTAHAAGYGTDGVTGRDLFATPAGVAGAAEAFAISTDLVNAPERIAAATDPSLSAGDNRNALALAGIADTLTALGGTGTAQEGLAALIGGAGDAVRRAELDASSAEDLAAQVQSMRDSVSGVSIDEEMINLAKYQRGYQASLRVVETADQMLQELVNLKR